MKKSNRIEELEKQIVQQVGGYKDSGLFTSCFVEFGSVFAQFDDVSRFFLTAVAVPYST